MNLVFLCMAYAIFILSCKGLHKTRSDDSDSDDDYPIITESSDEEYI